MVAFAAQESYSLLGTILVHILSAEVIARRYPVSHPFTSDLTLKVKYGPKVMFVFAA